MEKKFDLSEQVRKELEQKTDEAGKALEVKEKEIQDLKEKLRQVKEVAVREYRDSDALLGELGGSFLQDFDDALLQVKKAYLDLDVSMINVTTKTRRLLCPSPQRTQTISLLRRKFKATENQPQQKMFKMPTRNVCEQRRSRWRMN